MAVQHVDFMLVHWLSVQRERVSERIWIRTPDYYDFVLDTGAKKHRAELTILSDGVMLINEISLAVDGEEVLRHRVRWRDGAVSAVAILLVGLPIIIVLNIWLMNQIFG